MLAVVTRTYRDSEMVVWFASGQSLAKWIWPVLSFGLPLVLLTGALSFVATPWAKMKSNEFVQRFEKREDLKKVAPGQFKRVDAAPTGCFSSKGGANAANQQRRCKTCSSTPSKKASTRWWWRRKA